MAKIARAVVYVVSDENRKPKVIPVDYEEKTFEWSDDLVVNQDFCSKDEITKFYRELGGYSSGRNS